MLRTLIVATGLAAVTVAGCGSGNAHSPAKTAVNCTAMGAKTGVAGAKTGLTTGFEGVKTVGRSVGGFVEGGSEGAEREWRAGRADTRRVAQQGKEETRQEAHPPDCP